MKLKIKNITFQEGKPKICIPLTSCNLESLKEELNLLRNHNYDVVEWRIDFFEEDILYGLRTVYNACSDKPILVTCRTVDEGGNANITIDEYVALYKKIIDSHFCDFIDVQVMLPAHKIKQLIQYAQKCGIYVIGSYHNFNSTPSYDSLMEKMQYMQQLDVDICKFAMMPTNSEDVLTVLQFTNNASHAFETPLITMSMSKLGMISRMCGEVFGSCMTFAASKNTSAPGQISVDQMQQILDILHDSQQNE